MTVHDIGLPLHNRRIKTQHRHYLTKSAKALCIVRPWLTQRIQIWMAGPIKQSGQMDKPYGDTAMRQVSFK